MTKPNIPAFTAAVVPMTARLVAFLAGGALVLSSIDAIGARSSGSDSYWEETSFMALILRQQGKQTAGLGVLAMAASFAGLRPNGDKTDD